MIEFWVPGLPAPGGSKKAFVVGGRAVVTEDAKRNRPWRAAVALKAAEAMAGRPPLVGPLLLTLEFVVPRPCSHFRAGRRANPLKNGVEGLHPTRKPDLLKLCRSTEDALIGIVYYDDAQNVGLQAVKRFGDTPGVRVVAVKPDEEGGR